MEYKAKILKIHEMNEYEGSIGIEVVGKELSVWYQAPFDFAEDRLCVNEDLQVDLWLVCGKTWKVNNTQKFFSTGLRCQIDSVVGRVREVFSSIEFRVDAGQLVIDVNNDTPIEEVMQGDFVEVRGSYQIYFPGTEWDYGDIE